MKYFVGGKIPQIIESPDWDSGDDEMSECSAAIFALLKDGLPSVDLTLIKKCWDCIGFMSGSLLDEWLPVWMATTYFVDLLDNQSNYEPGTCHPIGEWTEFSIIRHINEGHAKLNKEGLIYFLSLDQGHRGDKLELYQAIESYCMP